MAISVVTKMVADFGGFLSKVKEVNSKLRDMSERMLEVSRASRNMGLAMAGGAAFAAKGAADFEKQLTKVAGVAAGTANNFDNTFKFLGDAALDFADKSIFTGEQVLQGMTKIGLAGSRAIPIVTQTGAAIELATAASVDLAKAADTVTNVMAGFGVTADNVEKKLTKKFGRAVTQMEVAAEVTKDLAFRNDVLVATFTGSNTQLDDLGKSFRKAGGIIKQMAGETGDAKQAFIDASAALGILGNAGIKQEEAGTALRRGMVQLEKGSGQARRALDSLGLKAGDIAAHGFPAVIKQLEFAQEQFIKAGKESAFTGRLIEAFGQRAGPALAIMVSQGSESLGRLIARIEGLQREAGKEGIAQFLAEMERTTFLGTIQQTISKLNGLRIAIGKELLPVLRPMIVAVGDAAVWLRQNLSPALLRAAGLATIFAGALLLLMSVLTLILGQAAKLTIALAILGPHILKIGKSFLTAFLPALPQILMVTAALAGLGLLAAWVVGELGKPARALEKMQKGALAGKSADELIAGADATPFHHLRKAWDSFNKEVIGGAKSLAKDISAWLGKMEFGLDDLLPAGGFGNTRRMISALGDWIESKIGEGALASMGESIANVLGGIPSAVGNVFTQLMDVLGVTKTIDIVGDAFVDMFWGIIGFAKKFGRRLSEIFSGIANWIGGHLWDIFGNAIEGMGETLSAFMTAMGAAGAQVGLGMTQIGAGIGESWAQVFKGVENLVTGIVKVIAALFDAVVGFAIDMGTGIFIVFADVKKKIAGLIADAADLLDNNLGVSNFFGIDSADIQAMRDLARDMTDSSSDFRSNIEQLRTDLKQSFNVSELVDRMQRETGGVLGFIAEMLSPTEWLASAKEGFADIIEKIFGEGGDALVKKFKDLFEGFGEKQIEALQREVNTGNIGRDGKKAKFEDDETLSDFIESMLQLTTEIEDMSSRFGSLNAMVTDFGEELVAVMENAPNDEMKAWAADMLRQRAALELAGFLNVGREAHKMGAAFKAATKAAHEMGIPMAEVERRLMEIDPDRVVAAQIPVLSSAISDALFKAARQSKGFDAKDIGLTKMLTDAIGNFIAGQDAGGGGLLSAFGSVIGGQFANAGFNINDAMAKMLGGAAGPVKGAIAGLFGMGGPIGAALGMAVGELAAQVIPAIEGFVAGVGDTTKKLGQFAAKLIPEQRLSRAVSGVAAGIGDFIKMIAPAAAVIGGVLLLAALALAGAAAFATLAFMVLFPVIVFVGGMLAAMGAAIAGIVAGFTIVAAVVASVAILFLAWTGLLNTIVLFFSFALSVIGSFIGSIIAATWQLISLALAFAGLLVVAGILGHLVTETESFKLFMEVLSRSVGRVIEALEPVMHNFRFLGGAFDFLMDVLIVFANAMAENAALGHILFEFVKMGLIAVVMFAIAVGMLQNALISFWQGFLTSGIGEAMIDAFMAISSILLEGGRLMLNAFEMIPEFMRTDEMNEALAQAADLLEPEDMASNLEDLRGAIENSGNALEGMRVEMEPLTKLLADARGMTIEELEARFDNLAAMEDTTKEMRENLVNVPSGFKVALERFRAISTGGVGALSGSDQSLAVGTGIDPGSPAAGGMVTNNFIFQDGAFDVASIDDLYNIIQGLIEQAAQDLYGNPTAGAGNR